MKRIYIPMPDPDTRRALLKHLLSGQPAKLSRADIERLVAATHNYSGSDLAALCREAAIIPIRQALRQVTSRPGFLCAEDLDVQHCRCGCEHWAAIQ